MPLRIGVNALYLIPGKVGGTEIYLRNVLHALASIDPANHYFIFRNKETGDDLTPRAANFQDRPLPVSGENRAARILYEQLIFPSALRKNNIEVLFNAGFTAPLLWPGPMVTVFHDLQYKRHPEYFRWFDLPFWQTLLPASARRSRKIVVPSEAVKADIAEFYPFALARTQVIPHGVEAAFGQIAATRQPQRFILTVSTLHPHKNLDGLLRAFAVFIRRHPDWRLVIAGLKGFEAGRIEALQKELGLQDAVDIKGWIPRPELYELFRTAAAFVYPSRFEGFGIPVLEAMTAGLPVACSRIPALVEVAGEAVRFFDPANAQDLVAALEDITENEDLRNQLRAAGLARARDFSWEKSARLLQKALNASARTKPRPEHH
jgi:glycosyltransferase involved in cell wall biosynthesis